MSIYGDMDISKINEKPEKRKKIITLSKPEKKINELWTFIKKQIENGNQVFWVCPLIEESKKIDHVSAVKKFEYLKKIFPNQVSLLHGKTDINEKEKILIIENATKFGLAQLHQLRGRVGRGGKQGTCILLFKDGLSKNAIKRIKILKNSDDGFFIAEQDMKLRGFGDLTGFQQSGLKNFRFADPVIHEDLFKLAENFVKEATFNVNQKKYSFLLKLFDKAEIINIEDF